LLRELVVKGVREVLVVVVVAVERSIFDVEGVVVVVVVVVLVFSKSRGEERTGEADKSGGGGERRGCNAGVDKASSKIAGKFSVAMMVTGKPRSPSSFSLFAISFANNSAIFFRSVGNKCKARTKSS
jgi:hypothetical protein